jgi:hypothetical protein
VQTDAAQDPTGYNVDQVRKEFRRAETKTVNLNQVLSFTSKYLKSEGTRKNWPPHMDVEAKTAFASRNIEIEAAIAEVQVPRWG